MEGKMEFNIALIPGDGIGPEIIREATRVLDKVGKLFSHNFKYTKVEAGGVSVDKYGEPLTKGDAEICKKSDAIILGAIGGEKWSSMSLDKKPEKAILQLRKELNLGNNLRPIFINSSLINFSPLKESILRKGLDILVVRDIVGGMICSEKRTGVGRFGREASDLEYYNEQIIKKTVIMGFEAAMKRRKKLASLDKANALESSMLWRTIVNEVSKEYPEVKVKHYLIDNASMEVIKNPSEFDVVVASNVFGDIIADELSQITGTSGILPSAELGKKGYGIFTPNQLHSTKESIVGKDIANPIGVILASALMLRYSLGLDEEASKVENAVDKVLKENFITQDLFCEGKKLIGTKEMGSRIADNI
jgi:3-isopropylmalate dehydrogenase